MTKISSIDRIRQHVNELAANKLTCVAAADIEAFKVVCGAFDITPCGGAFVLNTNGVDAQYFYI